MKKILFAMIETGGGHKAPARAVMTAMESAYPDGYTLRMVDFFKSIGCRKIDSSLIKGWNFLLMHPVLTHFLYQLQESSGPIARALLYRFYVKPTLSKTIHFLKIEKPDAIFSTHYYITEALVRARRKSGLKFEIFTYQTEIFTYHAAWKVPGTDWYITSSRRAEQKAARRGIPARKLRTFPYPISPEFLSSRRDRDVVAKELGLHPDRKTVLFSFGNQGASMVFQYILAMELFSPSINVIIATGRNAALKKRLDLMKRHLQKLNLVPMGYANNMNELISVADVCFIKPGPATMMECMHSRKPIIFSMAATPCEQEHANFAVTREVARDTDNSLVLFTTALRHFLKPEIAQQVANRYDSIPITNGAPDIAAFVHRVMTGSEPR